MYQRNGNHAGLMSNNENIFYCEGSDFQIMQTFCSKYNCTIVIDEECK